MTLSFPLLIVNSSFLLFFAFPLVVEAPFILWKEDLAPND